LERYHDYVKDPFEIERRSFEIIGAELGEKNSSGLKADMIKRVIHTTADLDYADLLQFKQGVEDKILSTFLAGCTIICDTNMIKAGISKKLADKLGLDIKCFVDSDEAYREAREKGITRSMAAVDIASRLPGKKIFVVGNAPTALYRILELTETGALEPEAVIGVPVGFVGAAESKEALWSTPIPAVITKGRKGGSTIGVALINAVLKEAVKGLGK
jgi:precorrin-8X/cobalt-precorrin-8 methylmutase